jgi:formate dehydrogenase major subunit
MPTAVEALSRRSFLRASGVGATIGIAGLTLNGMRASSQSTAQAAAPGAPAELKKTICPFCSVGCSIWAEVQNGVWVGQEPVFESPINMGTHCAKGAATRELAHGERRLKYPTKLVDGQWQRINWDQAIDEIGDKLLQIRQESGPDSVFWCGSSKFSNEAAYLHRKFVAMWGSNNVDHQARICHSTTVAGVASTYGYGAMTNSYNDIHNAKVLLVIGGNPAEAHPVSMLHFMRAKESGAKVIVVDPRFTRTARHADEYVRIRSGTDVAFLWGLLHEILANGWEDKDYIARRVFAFEDVRKEVEPWTAEETERVTGIPAAQVKKVAKMFAEKRPGTLIWCMGLTQSTIGINKVRAASIVQLALGNIGVSGGGANIYRGHDNVQGATDIGSNAESLPAYYGLTGNAWQHWANVWGVKYDWLKSRFASEKLMQTEGITISRWHDSVLGPEGGAMEQPNLVRAMLYWGHSPNSQTRGPRLKAAMEKVDLLVVIDPVPTATAVIGERRDGTYLLPAGTTMEMAGSVTNSQRALQWREKVINPIFEAKSDYEIMYLFARKLGYGDELVKNIKVENNEPVAEDILREINRSTWTIGYTGQSPERLKLHMQHQDKFHPTTTIGMDEPVKGEYYGLPWPCWGTPEMKHPGTPLLYDIHKPVAQGGLPFRANWGVEHEGRWLLAEQSYPPGSAIRDGYPEISFAILETLGWVNELSPREQAIILAIAFGEYAPAMDRITEQDARRRIMMYLERLGTKPSELGRERPAEAGTAEAALTAKAHDRLASDAILAFLRFDATGKKQVEETQQNTPQQNTPQQNTPKQNTPQRQGSQGGQGGQVGQGGQGTISDGSTGRGSGTGTGQAHSETNSGAGQQPQQGGPGAPAAPDPSGAAGQASAIAQKLRAINWKTDLSGGIQRVAIAHGLAPFGNGKARCNVWNYPDPVPKHREPLYTPRRDLLTQYRTYDDKRHWRLPALYWSIQQKDFATQFPLVLTSGRLVEFEGGGDETRAIAWLAEFQQQMFAEINPADAQHAGISDGAFMWLATPEGARVKVAALVTPRVGPGTVFMPFHFAGWWQGKDLSSRYPQGTVPFVVGESANTATTYGYDAVTYMQETKTTLCRIERA